MRLQKSDQFGQEVVFNPTESIPQICSVLFMYDLLDFLSPAVCAKLSSSVAAGTSSILAGALLAAVFRCTGRSYDTDSLIHAVLHLEQVLTTGKAVVTRRGEQ